MLAAPPWSGRLEVGTDGAGGEEAAKTAPSGDSGAMGAEEQAMMGGEAVGGGEGMAPEGDGTKEEASEESSARNIAETAPKSEKRTKKRESQVKVRMKSMGEVPPGAPQRSPKGQRKSPT